MIKIHIDTKALQRHEPAILVVPFPPSFEPAWPPQAFVRISCPHCEATVATVEQQANAAHVVVHDIEQLSTENT